MTLYYMEKGEPYFDDTDGSQREESDRESYTDEAEHGVSSWHEDGYLSSEFEDEPDGQEPETEPPDSHHKLQSHPQPRSSWKPSSRAIFHPTYKSKTRLHYDDGYEYLGPEFFLFSGLDYQQWKTNMHKYFWYYRTPNEEKLSIALGQLMGEALKWWSREEYERWYYKEPTIRTWGNLKWIMCERFSPQGLQENKNDCPPKKKATATNDNGEGLKPKTRLTFKEETDKMNKSFDHVLSLIKRLSCPKIVETGLGTKEELDTIKNEPKTLAELQPLQDIVSKRKSDHEDDDGILQVKCCVLKSLELTCYRCNQEGHVAKLCPTRKATSTLTLVEQHLSRDPKFIAKTLAEPLQVSNDDTLLNEPSLQINMSNKAKESLDAEYKREIVSSPKEVIISHFNDIVQTETCLLVFNDSMTVVTHLSSVQKVEEVSGTKEISSLQEACIQEELHGTKAIAVKNLTIKDVAQPCPQICGILSLILKKEEPPDPFKQATTRGNLLNPHVLKWTNLVWLCVGKSVLRTKPLEEGGNDANLASETSPTITWNTFSSQLGSTSNWNQPERSSHEEVMADTIRMGLNHTELDLCVLKAGFRAKHEEPNDTVICFGNLTHSRNAESWNPINSYCGSKVMIFTTRWILHLLHLEAAGFEKIQSYVWDPGESRSY